MDKKEIGKHLFAGAIQQIGGWITVGISLVLGYLLTLWISHDTGLKPMTRLDWAVIPLLFAIGFMLLFCAGLWAYPKIASILGWSLPPIDGTRTPASAAEERAHFLESRRKLEALAVGAEGTVASTGFDHYGKILTFFKMEVGGRTFELATTKNSGTEIYIYDSRDEGISTVAHVKHAKRGDLIDVRSLRAFKFRVPMKIGERAFLLSEDGSLVIQVLLVGVLSYNAGDDEDEARIRYKAHDGGEFLIPAL